MGKSKLFMHRRKSKLKVLKKEISWIQIVSHSSHPRKQSLRKITSFQLTLESKSNNLRTIITNSIIKKNNTSSNNHIN